MNACLFCKMIAGDISANIVHQTDTVLAFDDINPQAPHHVLIVPKRHIATINALEPDDAATVGELFLAARHIAHLRGIADDGYRVVMNCGEAAGQSVFHLHLHLLAGRALTWPPG